MSSVYLKLWSLLFSAYAYSVYSVYILIISFILKNDDFKLKKISGKKSVVLNLIYSKSNFKSFALCSYKLKKIDHLFYSFYSF